MRGTREVELMIGVAFLLGPMVYAFTLPTTVIEHVEVTVHEPTSVEPPECPPAEVEVEAEPTPTIAAPAEPDPARRPFMFVEGGKVILHADAPAEWGRGELFEPRGEVTFRAARSVDLERLPGDLAAQVDRSIDLYGRGGKLCTVTIDRLLLVAQYRGEGMAGVFDAGYPYDEEGWPIGVSRERIRELLWTTQSRWLVGELSDVSGCEGALWARDSALPAPTILTESERSNPTLRTRLRAFRRSPELAALEAEHEAFLADLDDEQRKNFPSWEALAAEGPVRGSAWLDAEGETRVVEVFFGNSWACSDYSLSLHKLEVLREGEFEATTWGVDPITVFDADLDGQFEVLHHASDYASDDGWGRRLDSVTRSLSASVRIDADPRCPC